MQNFLTTIVANYFPSKFAQRLLGGFAWNSFGAVTSRGTLLLANIIVARIVGVTSFGEFLIVTSTVLSVCVLVDLGLGLTATKFISEYRESNPGKIGNLLVFLLSLTMLSGLSVGFGLFFYAGEVASYLEAPKLEEFIKIISFQPIFLAAVSLGSGLIIGLEQFKKLAVINLIMGGLNLGGVIAGALLFGIEGVLWANLGLSIVNLAIVMYVLAGCLVSLPLSIKPNLMLGDFKKLFNFSFPSLMIGLTYGPPIWFCNALLVTTENGFEQMAILGAAMQWYAIATFLPGSLALVILPVSSNLAVTSSNQAFRDLIIKACGSSLLVTAPIVVLIALCSPFIMGLYGPGFSDGAKVLIILMCSGIFVSIQTIVGNTLSAKGKIWGQLVMNVSWALIFVAVAKMWVSSHGATGVVAARTIACFLLMVGSIAYAFFITRTNDIYQVESRGSKQ